MVPFAGKGHFLLFLKLTLQEIRMRLVEVERANLLALDDLHPQNPPLDVAKSLPCHRENEMCAGSRATSGKD